MNSKKLNSFALTCVSQYATFDKFDGYYSLDIYKLPDFIRNEFASLIMSFDRDLASEATGPDNSLYESTMLPALINYLKNSTDRDEQIEFNFVWKKSITSYFDQIMQDLINDALIEFNYDFKIAQNF